MRYEFSPVGCVLLRLGRRAGVRQGISRAEQTKCAGKRSAQTLLRRTQGVAAQQLAAKGALPGGAGIAALGKWTRGVHLRGH